MQTFAFTIKAVRSPRGLACVLHKRESRRAGLDGAFAVKLLWQVRQAHYTAEQNHDWRSCLVYLRPSIFCHYSLDNYFYQPFFSLCFSELFSNVSDKGEEKAFYKVTLNGVRLSVVAVSVYLRLTVCTWTPAG